MSSALVKEYGGNTSAPAYPVRKERRDDQICNIGDLMRNLGSGNLCSAVALVIPFLWSSGAGATGATYARAVEKTSIDAIAPCRGGKIVEQLFWGGGVRGEWHRYVLACLTGARAASWILISGTTVGIKIGGRCSDEEQASGQCVPRSSAEELPEFNANPAFGEETKQPFVMEYNLIKYGLGRNCRVIRQRYTRSSETLTRQPDTQPFESWLCNDLDLFDGTHSADGAILDGPKQFRSIRLKTVLSKPLGTWKRGQPLEHDIVDTFILRDGEYTYSVDVPDDEPAATEK
jgi:hypothetical protein